MNKRWATVTIIVLLLVFVGYIVVDLTLRQETSQGTTVIADTTVNEDMWFAERIFEPGKGQLNALSVTNNGRIILGGELYIAFYDQDFNLQWEYKPEMPVTALTEFGDHIYAAIQNIILVLNMKGEKLDEWGPFETNAHITSLAANEKWVAFADAANKKVFVLDREGVMKAIIGKPEDPFILPSFYFDIAFDSEDNLFVANTGNRRIEKRKIDGTLLSYFGEAGTDKSAFCGCCNPSHFILIPGGFVTAEKGINRIKILNGKGEFMEFVSSANRFVPALPLDIASQDGKVIYGANPADSKVYVFKRK
jgi:hypothetical protein